MIASFPSSLFIEQTPNCCSLGKAREEYGGRARPPIHILAPSYGIGFGLGSGATPQISVAQGNAAKSQVGMMVSLPWVDAV